MLGRQNPQMDLADAVLWAGKIDPKPLVEKDRRPYRREPVVERPLAPVF